MRVCSRNRLVGLIFLLALGMPSYVCAQTVGVNTQTGTFTLPIGANNTVVMTVYNNGTVGYVGIGSTLPTQKLDVAGNIVLGVGATPAATTSTIGSLIIRGNAGNFHINMNDGSRMSILYNSTGTNGAYEGSDQANRITMHVGASAGYIGFYGAAAGTAGVTVPWVQMGEMQGEVGGVTTGDIWFSPRSTSTDFYINGSGNVGIGAIPTSKLDIDGDSNASDFAVRSTASRLDFYAYNGISGSPNPGANYIESSAANGTGFSSLIFTGGSGGNGSFTFYGQMAVLANGAGGPGGGNITVQGNVTAAAYFYSSDMRLKTDIHPIDHALNKIMAFKGVTFNWKKDERNGAKADQVGFIAQDVEKVVPEIVSTNPATGMKAVDYARITPFLVKGMQEQQHEIEALKAEIEDLKAAH